jgi:hypothetical protein
VLSALARFDAVTLSRCDCADIAEPATPNMFIKEGMFADLSCRLEPASNEFP